MPTLATRGNSASTNYSSNFTGDADALDGSVIVKPNVVFAVGTGATASVGNNGSVTFADCIQLELCNMFNENYLHYWISIIWSATADQTLFIRYILNDSIIGSNTYSNQYTLLNQASAASAARNTSTAAFTLFSNPVLFSMASGSISIYGTQGTNAKNTRALSSGVGTAGYLFEYSTTQSGTSKYNGLAIACNAGQMSGRLTVHGLAG